MLGAIIVIVLLVILGWLIKVLISSMKKHPDEHQTLHSRKSVQEVADEIRGIVGEFGASIEKIENDPLGNYGVENDIAVVLHGRNHDLVGSEWAVQIYANDCNGNGSDIELVALSQSASGTYGGINIAESRAKKDLIVSRLI